MLVIMIFASGCLGFACALLSWSMGAGMPISVIIYFAVSVLLVGIVLGRMLMDFRQVSKGQVLYEVETDVLALEERSLRSRDAFEQTL